MFVVFWLLFSFLFLLFQQVAGVWSADLSKEPNRKTWQGRRRVVGWKGGGGCSVDGGSCCASLFAPVALPLSLITGARLSTAPSASAAAPPVRLAASRLSPLSSAHPPSTFPCRSTPAMADDSPFGDFTNDQQQSSPYVEEEEESVIALPPPSVPTTDRQTDRQTIQPPHVHQRLQCSDRLQCADEQWRQAQCWCGVLCECSRMVSFVCDGSLTRRRWARCCVCLLAVGCWLVATAVAMTTPSRVAMHRCTMVRLRMHSV